MFLGRDTETGQFVSLSLEAMLRGVYLIGKPGSGKTTLIETMLSQAHKGYGLCLLDKHRDLSDSFLSRLDPSREKDVIVFDLLDPTHVPGLNLLQCNNPHDIIEVSRLLSSVLSIFAKLYTETGDLAASAPNMAEVLQMSLPVLISHQHPRMTLAEIPLLLTNETARKKLLAPVQNPYVCHFWNNYTSWRHDRQEDLIASTRRRVENFLVDSLILDIIGQSETTLPLRPFMDFRKIIDVKLSRDHELVSSLIGCVLVSLIAQAAFSRSDIPENKRVPFLLCCDEVQLFDIPVIAELLSEARKEKIATIVAHQFRDQLSKENRGATVNAANMVVFQVSGSDAQELATSFDATPPAPTLITGFRPVQSVKNDPIEHLKRNAHAPQVNEFVQRYLLPALRTVENNKRSSYQIRVYPFQGSPPRKIQISDLDEACQQLNKLFYAVMTDRDAQKPIPPFVFWMFAKLYGFNGGFLNGFAFYKTRWSFWTSHELPSVFLQKDALRLICAPEYDSHTEELASTIAPHILEKALAFVKSLRAAIKELANAPILVNTGVNEAIYDKPRQYADVQNEIASSLANLPPYTARVKIIGKSGKPVEHTIKTVTTVDLGISALSASALEDRIARIHANNIKDGFLVERSVVRQEILQRHEYLTRPDKRRSSHQEDEEE